MEKAEAPSYSPFPDFLLRMCPIFTREDVRAAQVRTISFAELTRILAVKVRLVGSEAIFARVVFKLKRLQVTKSSLVMS